MNPDLTKDWPAGLIADDRLPPGVVYIMEKGGFTEPVIQQEWEIYHADKEIRRKRDA